MTIKDTVTKSDGTIEEYEATLYPSDDYHDKPHYRVLIPVEDEAEARALADQGYQLRMTKVGTTQKNLRSLSNRS